MLWPKLSNFFSLYALLIHYLCFMGFFVKKKKDSSRISTWEIHSLSRKKQPSSYELPPGGVVTQGEEGEYLTESVLLPSLVPA